VRELASDVRGRGPREWAVQIRSLVRSTPPIVWALVLIALAARVAIASLTTFHSDEFQELFAAQMILEKGLPIFPSGTLWPTGGPMPYLEAPMIAWFGLTELPARIPGVLISTGTIWFVYVVGKELVGREAAIIAALAWSLDPDAIQWGAYTRQYSLHPLLVLVTLFLWRKAACTGPSMHVGLGAAASMTATVWTQPPTVLWGPAFVASYAIWASYVNLRGLVLSGVICTIAVSAVIVAVYLGDPGLIQSSSLQGSLVIWPNIHDPWSFLPVRRYQPFLTGYAHRYLLLLLALALFAVALIESVISRSRWETSRDTLALCAMATLGYAALGYFYYIQPGYGLALLIPVYLVGAAGLVRFLQWAIRLLMAGATGTLPTATSSQNRTILLLLALLTFAPSLRDAIGKDFYNLLPEASLGINEGYRFVGSRWHPGDVMLNANPEAYFSTPKGSPLFYFCERSCGLGLMRTRTGWVDRMLGAPVIASIDQLQKVLNDNAVVWWIAMDRELYSERYSQETRELVLKRMKTVFRFNTTSVYLQDRRTTAVID
jgi:hypothetical protein